MGLDYYVKNLRMSWNISLWGQQLTFGFWMNIVTDKVVNDHPRVAGGNRHQQYQYRQLDNPNDIRVIELAPGAPNDPLRVRIIHNSHLRTISEHGHEILEWSVPYDALSYVWGSGWADMSYILVDDEYSLAILPNLDVALRRFRSPKEPRILWVDAICINQQSAVEKSTQVALMLDIYARAENVQIWLGPARMKSSIGMQALKYLAEKTLDEPAPWQQRQDVAFFPALNDILQRDWFHRIWVLQESCVSRKAIMTCGNDSFQWENDPSQVLKFIRRIKFAAISPQWEQAGLSQVNTDTVIQLLYLQIEHIERQRKEILRPSYDILDIAYASRHRKATDRRDKLFAIMGLVNQRDETFFSAGLHHECGGGFQNAA